MYMYKIEAAALCDSVRFYSHFSVGIGQSVTLDRHLIRRTDLLNIPLHDDIAKLLVKLDSGAGSVGLFTGDERGAGATEGVEHQRICHAAVHNRISQQRDRLHCW